MMNAIPEKCARKLTEEDGSTFCIVCGCKRRPGGEVVDTDYPPLVTCTDDECIELGNKMARQAMGIR